MGDSPRRARVLRFPPLQFEVEDRPRSFAAPGGWTVQAHGAYLREVGPDGPAFRAFVPSPRLEIGGPPGPFALALENVHPAATGGLTGAGTVAVDGVARRIVGELAEGCLQTAEFTFPERSEYRFLAVGDTGAGDGLRTTLAFADELGADFVLHLGDFFYGGAGEQNVGPSLRSSRLPVFAACGNHDFHGGRRSRRRPAAFVREVGPLSSWFRIAGVDFLNLDTAAGFLPFGGGARGRVLREIAAVRAADAAAGARAPLVVFCHRPLLDPRRAAGARAMGGLDRFGEGAYLARRLSALGAGVILAAHVHQSWEFEAFGFRTLLAGEGLGREVPHLNAVLGRFTHGRLPEFSWQTPHPDATSLPPPGPVRRLPGQDDPATPSGAS